MPHEIKRWKCNHCRKHFSSKNYAEKHERGCFFNLDKKACPTCIYFNQQYKNQMYKCSNPDCERSGQDTEVIHYGPGVDVEDYKYPLLTMFIQRNCPYWDNGETPDEWEGE